MARAHLLLLAALVSCTGFREGAPGLFRSPQPSEETLIQRIEDHGIRTVVSMRGGRNARIAARAALVADLDHVAIPISAKRPVPPDALLQLWEAAREAERPILVHCRAGVDRTGLAMAVLVLHDTDDLVAALQRASAAMEDGSSDGRLADEIQTLADSLPTDESSAGRIAALTDTLNGISTRLN